MDGDASFGYWLKLRHQALRLTQGMLASRVYCSSELIRKIECVLNLCQGAVSDRAIEALTRTR
jgi:hypothetical protein